MKGSIFIACFIGLFYSLTCCPARAQSLGEISIDADFPGGNIVVDSITGNDVFLHQNLRDTEINWFYWYFRVSGVAGKTVTFHFTHPWKGISARSVIGVRGPAVSFDEGWTWRWLGADIMEKNSFRFTFPENEREVRFSFGMPYTERNLHAFLDAFGASRHLEVDVLARTREGRPVERIHLGVLHGKPKFRVLLTVRHHACEMMASYLLEGVMATVLEKEGSWLRENVEILVIPFMDKDGVEDGDQGKGRRARDHNRDYSEKSIYTSTNALRAYFPVWAEDLPVIAIDLHCPSIRGKDHEKIHFVQIDDGIHASAVNTLSGLLEDIVAVQPGSLPYHASYNMPFGASWNTPANYTKGKSMASWASGFSNVKLAATLEFPYANASGSEVTAESAREFGRSLALSIQRYLENNASGHRR